MACGWHTGLHMRMSSKKFTLNATIQRPMLVSAHYRCLSRVNANCQRLAHSVLQNASDTCDMAGDVCWACIHYKRSGRMGVEHEHLSKQSKN